VLEAWSEVEQIHRRDSLLACLFTNAACSNTSLQHEIQNSHDDS
jgi:hypothetical protein